MKVLIFGASGILGQHLLMQVPDGVKALAFRQKADGLFDGCDLTDVEFVEATLNNYAPEVVVNFAGESNTDNASTPAAEALNVQSPALLAAWCDTHNAHYVHISSQAVFSGENPPYDIDSATDPINAYGLQKRAAEREIQTFKNWTIIRPTFVLGVRPIPSCGRINPAEQALAGDSPELVNDRWFSPLFAEDAAGLIWSAIQIHDPQQIIHLGIPRRVSRYDVGKALGADCQPVSHDSFPGIAPRPVDTTYDAATSRHLMSWDDGIAACKRLWHSRQVRDVEDKAIEIALFKEITKAAALERLNKGFGFQHAEVAADFRRANAQQSDEALLDWYRQTESYIWELSTYHADPAWNYRGMCAGIAERLGAAGAKRVLVLGDGIGELTLALRQAGFDAVYHDLAGSRTSEFAHFRFERWGVKGESQCTEGWDPKFRDQFDAVCSMDFLEHVTSVESYVDAIKGVLKPGGLFCVQNAFNIGSGPDGSMPMHLERNNHFEKDWDPLLFGMGFSQEGSNWYVAPTEKAVAA